MSALTSIFNFLYVYLRIIVAYVFGTKIYVDSFPMGESREIFRAIINEFGFGNYVYFEPQPLLILIVGVVSLGAIIGLVRRLMK